MGQRYSVAFRAMLYTLPDARPAIERSSKAIFDTEVGAVPFMQRQLRGKGDRLFSCSSRHVCVLDGKGNRAASLQAFASGHIRGFGASPDGLIALVGSDGDVLILPNELILGQGMKLNALK